MSLKRRLGAVAGIALLTALMGSGAANADNAPAPGAEIALTCTTADGQSVTLTAIAATVATPATPADDATTSIAATTVTLATPVEGATTSTPAEKVTPAEAASWLTVTKADSPGSEPMAVTCTEAAGK
jgi:hypothetical protein